MKGYVVLRQDPESGCMTTAKDGLEDARDAQKEAKELATAEPGVFFVAAKLWPGVRAKAITTYEFEMAEGDDDDDDDDDDVSSKDVPKPKPAEEAVEPSKPEKPAEVEDDDKEPEKPLETSSEKKDDDGWADGELL